MHHWDHINRPFFSRLDVRSALACVASIAFLTVGCYPATDKGNKSLAERIAEEIPRPKPGEFPTPESAASFLIQNVAENDFDQALRAFPVIEKYERGTLDVQTKSLEAFEPSMAPLPGHDCHNLLRPLMSAAADFRAVRLAFIGVAAERVTVFESEPGRIEFVETVSEKQKKRLEIGRMTCSDDNRKSLGDGSGDTYYTSLGATEMGSLTCEIEVEGRTRVVLFTFLKIDGNWRITSARPDASR